MSERPSLAQVFTELTRDAKTEFAEDDQLVVAETSSGIVEISLNSYEFVAVEYWLQGWSGSHGK